MELPSERADLDLMTADRQVIAELGLDQLRLGDLVALQHHDHSYGRGYYEDAVTIGLIVHGDSRNPGHGPGIATLLTSRSPVIQPRIDPQGNITRFLDL
jgi:hypothetical protein